MLQLVLESASYKQYLTFSLKYPFVLGGNSKLLLIFGHNKRPHFTERERERREDGETSAL